MSIEELAGSRETAVVDVARALLGPAGAGAALLAGLLATVSSANASILSASRTLFALARDGEIPRPFARVSQSFSSPWIAVLSVGVPAAALSYLGLELLAEVAALLHLVIYALICLAAARLHSDSPEWYEPSFDSPGAAWLPVLTAVTCIGLITFMQPLAIGAGLGVLTLAAATYAVYRWFLRSLDRD
jgi:amino acid transporter